MVLPGSEAPSEATRHLVEAEIRRIVDECYARAVDELRENRPRLDRLAAALLEHETLDEADAYRVAGLERAQEAARARPPTTALSREVDSVSRLRRNRRAEGAPEHEHAIRAMGPALIADPLCAARDPRQALRAEPQRRRRSPPRKDAPARSQAAGAAHARYPHPGSTGAERTVLAWAGLQGAATMILAAFAVIAGVQRAIELLNSCSVPCCSQRL